MVIFGLVVPLRLHSSSLALPSAAESSDKKDVEAAMLLQRAPSGLVREGADQRPVFLGLVPALLPDRPLQAFSPKASKTCYIGFAADGAFLSRDSMPFSDLSAMGFCPNGIFARVLGKAVQYAESTDGMQPTASLKQVST